MHLADHITCRVLGIDDVLRAVEPRSESGDQLARTPRCFGAADRDAWLARRHLQAQVESWWTEETTDALSASFEQLPTLDAPLRVLRSGEALDDVGLFELKRFLYHAARIAEAAHGAIDLIDGDWREALATLMATIHPEQQPTPRFRLSAQLDARLADARKRLKAARKVEQQQRRELETQLVAELGGRFDVRGRFEPTSDVADARLRAVGGGKFEIADAALGDAADAADDAQEQVRGIENAVRATLSQQLVGHVALLDDIREALAEVDVLCALSELCASWDGSWPQWEGVTTAIEAGRHPWLLELPDGAQAISIALTRRPAVVTGPNMGGKSMLLKLIGLCQWCAQHGFPVPAAQMQFSPVDQLVYVGADAEDDMRSGLSSFGREVRRVVEQRDDTRCTLWLLDELGRGTHPEEGAAIARDFVESRAAAEDRVVAATHFPSLAHWEGAEHFQIAGLTDPAALDALREAEGIAEIEAALRAAMDYTPVVRSAADADVPRDARRVARALGLVFED